MRPIYETVVSKTLFPLSHGDSFIFPLMTFILVEALQRVQYGKIARGYGRETNIAQGEAKYYIRIEIKPNCIYHIALVAMLQLIYCAGWFI